MIELPRAALMAGDIAQSAEFFSFGTNDLTQTTFGISRDDAASFLGTYVARGILPIDPFVSLDRDGVGELVKIGVAARTQDASGPEGRHLRRTWRRSGVGRLLQRRRSRLRVVLALPRADRAPRSRAGRARQGSGQPGVMLRSAYEMQKPGLMPGFLLMRTRAETTPRSKEVRRPALTPGGVST